MKKLTMILPMALILCFMVGCQDKQAMAELEEFKAQAEVEEQNKELVKELFAAIDAGNFDKLKELFADDFSLKVPGFAEPWETDMLFKAIKSHYIAFPDWTHVIEDVVTDGDRVAIKLNQNGTHKAEYEGISATDIEATLPAMHLFTVKNGKVIDWFAVEDYLGLYMQLGMELRPKSNIQISHASGLAGHDITVMVTAEGDEGIKHVRTVFDGRPIGNDSLTPPHSVYKREFVQQGGYTPGRTHRVLVEATSTIGKTTASLIWTDQ